MTDPPDGDEDHADCDHVWEFVDDSFDHEFGCEVIEYWLCELCGESKPTLPGDFAREDGDD